MFVDARRIDDDRLLECDLCIAGAGAAGITLAHSLSGTSLKVLLLETGGFGYDLRTQKLNAGYSVGRPYGVVNNRLRYFGGTTNHWDGWCRPLDAIDFERRDWIPYSGWPLRRAELDRFYVRAAELCQLPHRTFDARDWGRITGTRPFRATADVASTAFQVSPPTRFGETYRGALRRARNVDVLLHATVVHVGLVPNARSVREVRVATLSGRRFAVRARRFVLAGGALENARLLLVSNDVRPRGIGNDRDLVGRFFADHPHVPVGWVRFPTDPRVAAYYGVHSRDGRPRAEGGLVTTDRFVRSRRLLRSYLTCAAGAPPSPIGAQVRAVERDLAGLDLGVERALTIRTEQAPNRDSRLTLIRQKDELGVPLIELDWRIGELERRSAARSVEAVGSALASLGVARVFDRLVVDRERAWHSAVGGSHHMGTVRMAANPSTGVVDSDCRVHGVSNLYVAGSAVFATTGYANPTLTIVALAVRMAEHLRRSLA